MAKKKAPTPKSDPKEVKNSKDAKESSKSSKGSKNSKDALPDPGQVKRANGRTTVAQSSSWTGKLPGSLLHEHCQQQKWNKVEYDMKKTKEGFISIPKLSWKNPKTQEVIEVRMVPSSIIKPQETPLEARHYGATYALHRIASHKNIHMVLPSNHKSLWLDLEAERKQMVKSNPLKAKSHYAQDPFNAVLEKRKEDSKRAKEMEAKIASENKLKKPSMVISTVSKSDSPTGSQSKNSTNKNNYHTNIKDSQSVLKNNYLVSKISFPRKVWDETTFIDFNSKSRSIIENIIRSHIRWSENEAVESLSDKSDESQKLSGTLSNLGFRTVHIEEALKYCTTFQECIEWLIFHIPEDDLPVIFSKSDSDSSLQVKISKDIKRDYIIQRLQEGGFSKTEVITALSSSQQDEVQAGVTLSCNLINDEKLEVVEDNSQVTPDDSIEMWNEEIESLKSIFGEEKIKTTKNESIYEVRLEPQDIKETDLLSLRIYKSELYPQSLPGLHIIVKNQSYRLANYIKVSIVNHLIRYIIDTGMLGMPFIFSCIEWLESNISNIIENPGPLYDTTHRTAGIYDIEYDNTNDQSQRGNKKRNTNTSKRRDIDKLRNEYQLKIKTAGFKDSMNNRAKLPAWDKKNDLIKTIMNNKVSLITGETGSGKSTQIVQFILDELNKNDDFVSNIVCTQPRRISTIGLSDRISDERCDASGNETGYIIRGENKTNINTRISFVTTGILLRMIQGLVSKKAGDKDIGDDYFKNLSYIFIDEVHERSVDSDFLLIILKNIMNKYHNLKVVLMSATINIDVFKNYFKSNVCHIHISGRTFPIKDHYLDEILDDLEFEIDTGDKIVRPKADSKFFQLGNINYDLISKLVNHVDGLLNAESNKGSILIFLPGVMEINKCIKTIQNNSGSKTFHLLPLHSALSSSDQKRVFKDPPYGSRKIVVSTNVAETSITIPDAVAVIDTGRVKSVHYDAKAKSTRLLESWCSRAEAAQRRGRAGRVTEGRCFKLYTESTEKETMRAQPIPEIKRTSLESVYLVVKAIGVNNVKEFLNGGLDPPSSESLSNAREYLSEIGALVNDKLTSLGKYLSIIPTDIKSGKLLIFGTLFGNLEDSLTLASISVSGNPFIVKQETRDEVKKIQQEFGKGKGDLHAILNAFNAYNSVESGKKRRFLNDKFLSSLTMTVIQSTRQQFISTLKDLGFIPFNYSSTSESYKYLNRNKGNTNILNALIASSSYPQIARIQLPDPKYMASSSGAVALDPDSKNTKIWIKNEEFFDKYNNGEDVSSIKEGKVFPSTRGFLHPSSTMFTFSNNTPKEVSEASIEMDMNGNYVYKPSAKINSSSQPLSSPFIIYDSSQITTKYYLRDVTPVSALSVLLFGGSISYDLSFAASNKPSPGVVMDDWLPIRTWCKNGVLVVRLRHLLDAVIARKLSVPYYKRENSANFTVGDDIIDAVEKILSIENRSDL